MTSLTQDNQVVAPVQQNNDKENNFRRQEQAIQAKYERELAQERNARLEAERKYAEISANSTKDEDNYSEPYVDDKRLDKKLDRFGKQVKQETHNDIQSAVQGALREERKANWLKSNPDFYDVLQHAEKLAQHDPDLADSILEMPESFERQKLVYKNIKALGIHRPVVAQPSIQDKIDANRRSPYYQPSGTSTAPYSQSSDFSANGQKSAYDKMQQLKNNLRI